MVVFCFLWINIVLILLYNPSSFGDTKKSGPYKSTLENVKPCDNPFRPYIKDSPMTFEVRFYNISDRVLFDADFIVNNNTKNVKTRVTCFGWEKGKWIPNYLVSDMGCHGTILHLIHKAMGVQHDSVNCSYLKGHYHVKNFDQNVMQHILLPKSEYGRKMWKAELYNTQLGMFFCIEFYLLMEPI